jgi:peptide chain release factor subunit 1
MIESITKGNLVVTVEELKKLKLSRVLEQLEKIRGRGTELISLYIPPGRSISLVINDLHEEYSTASNIKDRVTRHHVLDALVTIMQKLKLYREIPPNGLAIFCGAIAKPNDPPGSEKINIFEVEPIEPISTYLYRCDDHFHLDILKDMLREKAVFGLITIDREEATFALLKGNKVEILDNITSGVPGKHRAGGQSARRFERIIEEMAHEFYKRVGDYASKYFLNIPNLKGIIIGGPGPTKKEFYDGNYLHYQLKSRILGIIDVGYADESGIYELLYRCDDLLKDVALIEEAKNMQEFLEKLAKGGDDVAYGFDDVVKHLENGSVEKVLVSSNLDLYIVEMICMSCGFKDLVKVEQIKLNEIESQGNKCKICGGTMKILSSKYIVEYLNELADKTKADVKLISLNTGEGKELFNSFGGIAAILRYIHKYN